MSDGTSSLPADGGAGRDFLRGATDMLPMAIGAAPFGIMVGALAGQAGLTLGDILLMSTTVYAGASQFTALGLWEQPTPVLTIIAVTLLVNLRHVLMGAALAPHIRHLPVWCRWSFLSVMSDETWATALNKTATAPLTTAYVAGVIFPFYINWIIFSGLGRIIGQVISDPAAFGFDFVFTAVFLSLCIGFWQRSRRWLPFAVAIIAALTAKLLLPGAWFIFIGGLAGTLAAAAFYSAPAHQGGD